MLMISVQPIYVKLLQDFHGTKWFRDSPADGGLVISNSTVPVSMSLILNLVKSML